MHTVIVIGAGLASLVACLLLGHAWAGGMPGLVGGAKVFIPLWLAGAGVNLWIGVARAGYTVADELPIFIGIFAVPALLAGLVIWFVR